LLSSGILLRVFGIDRPEHGPALPPRFVRRQNPMHRETPRATAAPAPPAIPDRRQGPVPQPHQAQPGAAAEKPVEAPGIPGRTPCPAVPPGPPRHRAIRDKNPMHRQPVVQPSRPAVPEPQIAHQDPMHREVPPPPRSGPLRNGNPRGNPNAARRCGARTRAGCPCRAPALRGKARCRMHGGASTGPSTAEGLERLRAARTTHGHYAAPARAQRRFLLTFIRRAQVQYDAMRLADRLPQAARVRLLALPPELAMPPSLPHGEAPPSRAADRATMQAEAEALAPWKRAIEFARAARHMPSPPDAVQALEALFLALDPVPPPAAARPGLRPQQAHQDREQHQRRRLQHDPPAHQPVGARRVAAAAHHPHHAGEQHAQRGEHQQHDEKREEAFHPASIGVPPPFRTPGTHDG
jgi:hypothetical protein